MRYFSFQWHITDNCDQRCKHCYIFSGGNPHVPETMTREEMHTVLDNCLDFCETFGRIPYFYVTGGDPILHPFFWELLETFRANNIFFSILGNPFHIDDSICEKLQALGCEKYQLSIDGMRTTHDFFRKPGSFDTTLEKISCINKAGISSVIMSTVSKQNIHEIPSVIDVVVEHEAEIYSFARYCPTGAGEITGITPNEYREFLRVCDEKFTAYEAQECRTYFDRKDHLWTLYNYESGKFTIPPDAEDGKIYLGTDGDGIYVVTGNIIQRIGRDDGLTSDVVMREVPFLIYSVLKATPGLYPVCALFFCNHYFFISSYYKHLNF